MPDLPPPTFASVGSVMAQSLPVLTPAQRVTVPQWAEGNRRIVTISGVGAWRNDFAPYITEPAMQITSRRYGAVVFAGPARSAKSEGLIINPLGHAIACKPRDAMVVCQTQDSAKQFSEKKLGPLLRNNRVLAEAQATGRGADNLYEKRFRGNMHLKLGWPVIGNFSQNEWFTVLLTDYDRFPEDIDGEGSGFALARKRTQHAGSLGMVVCESSPGRLVERDDWAPTTIHEAPPCTGVLAEYNAGTRARWYWDCPECGAAFQPVFERLQWDKRDSPGETARTATMGCPHCGSLIAPKHKIALNRGGRWLHEANDGQTLVEIGDAAIRDTDVVSYWMEGPAAAMQSWEQLVLRYLQAREQYDQTGDEQALKATINLDQGRPHWPMVRTIGDTLSEDALRALAKRYPIKIAPTETRFITIAVDVQQSRFVVQVDAWGDGLERWLIDRFDIVKPPAQAPGADGGRAIDPARYAEDWAAVSALLESSWPVGGTDYRMTARALIVDSGGAAGVTDNAYRFWRHHKKLGQSSRVFIAKGRGGVDMERAVYAAPEKVLGQKKKRFSDIMLVKVGTDPLKDETVMALTRKEAGPGKYHLTEMLDAHVFGEFCAEQRTEKGWIPRKQGLRNEALDLAGYAKALTIVLRAERINWASPPNWAGPLAANPFAILQIAGREPVPVSANISSQRRRRVRSKGI